MYLRFFSLQPRPLKCAKSGNHFCWLARSAFRNMMSDFYHVLLIFQIQSNHYGAVVMTKGLFSWSRAERLLKLLLMNKLLFVLVSWNPRHFLALDNWNTYCWYTFSVSDLKAAESHPSSKVSIRKLFPFSNQICCKFNTFHPFTWGHNILMTPC